MTHSSKATTELPDVTMMSKAGLHQSCWFVFDVKLDRMALGDFDTVSQLWLFGVVEFDVSSIDKFCVTRKLNLVAWNSPALNDKKMQAMSQKCLEAADARMSATCFMRPAPAYQTHSHIRRRPLH